ncbi:MAG: hypothetical protein JO099_03420 [Acidobacteriia bacterium]|nr:hypothetical protein [Terriglobia bacterium]
MTGVRQIFGRSIAIRNDLPAGSVLRTEDLVLKKPGTGIPPERMFEIAGRTLTRAVSADRLLAEEDLVAVVTQAASA